MKEAVNLVEYAQILGFTLNRCRIFTDTLTFSTCMYYTGIHPLTGEKVYVPKILMKSSNSACSDVVQKLENRELISRDLNDRDVWIW